jgi:hypothetical protein
MIAYRSLASARPRPTKGGDEFSTAPVGLVLRYRIDDETSLWQSGWNPKFAPMIDARQFDLDLDLQRRVVTEDPDHSHATKAFRGLQELLPPLNLSIVYGDESSPDNSASAAHSRGSILSLAPVHHGPGNNCKSAVLVVLNPGKFPN